MNTAFLCSEQAIHFINEVSSDILQMTLVVMFEGKFDGARKLLLSKTRWVREEILRFLWD